MYVSICCYDPQLMRISWNLKVNAAIRQPWVPAWRCLQYLLGPEQRWTGLQGGCSQGWGALRQHRTQPGERKTPQARQPRHQHGCSILSCISLRDEQSVMYSIWRSRRIMFEHITPACIYYNERHNGIVLSRLHGPLS